MSSSRTFLDKSGSGTGSGSWIKDKVPTSRSYLLIDGALTSKANPLHGDM